MPTLGLNLITDTDMGIWSTKQKQALCYTHSLHGLTLGSLVFVTFQKHMRRWTGYIKLPLAVNECTNVCVWVCV